MKEGEQLVWTEAQEQELHQLERELEPALQSVLVSQPSQRETQALLTSLLSSLEDEDREEADVWQTRRREAPALWPQVKAQAKMHGKSFWIVSALLFTLLTIMMQDAVVTPEATGLITLWFTPLVLLTSLVYSFRTWDAGMRAVESVTVFPPALLLLSRFLVVLLLDLALVLIGSVYILLTAKFTSLVVHPFMFVIGWMTPLLFFFGVTANVMLYKGVKTGMVTATALWLFTCALVVSDTLALVVVPVCFLLGTLLSIRAYVHAKRLFRVTVS